MDVDFPQLDLKSSKLARVAIGINVLSVVSFSLILLFQIVLAKEFGVSWMTDAYVGASALPLAIIGTMASLLEKTYVPVFFERCYQKDASRDIYNILTMCFLFLCLLVVIGYIGAPFLIKLILPGFLDKPYYLAIKIFKVFLIAVFFGGLAGFLTPCHYTQGSFILPNIAPVLKWLIAIIFIFSFKNIYGIISVAIGMAAGYIIQCVMLSSTLHNIRKAQFVLNIKNRLFLNMLVLMIPLAMAHVFNGLNILVMKGIASTMGEGSISCLEYSYNIMNIAIILCVQGISVVMFPLFSQYAAKQNIVGLKKIFMLSQRVLFLIIVPLMGYMLILRVPIIKLLFERGKFGPAATVKIANLFFGFCGAFLGLALGTLQSQVYYALKNTKRIMLITMIQMVLFILLILILKHFLFIYAIPIAFSIAMIFGFLLNYININKKLRIGMRDRDMFFAIKIVIAASIMIVFMFFFFAILHCFSNNLFLLLGFTAMASGSIYFIILYYVFRLPELIQTLNMVLPRKYAIR